MEVLIWKARRMLESRQEGRVLLRCPIALGREPVGPKEREGGTASDWTQGCIALESADMARLFERWQDIETVTILP